MFDHTPEHHRSDIRPDRSIWRWSTSGLASAFLVLLTTGAVGSYSSVLPSQHSPAHPNVAGDPDVKLGADRVLIGPEYVPRRTDLPSKLIVPAGQVIELPADASYDYIEVAGTLRVSREHDTFTRFTHFVILHGGTLDAGTQADPIPCDRKVEFVIRNVPIDTAKDPFQWGNGLVSFGRQTRVGCSKTAWVEAAGSILSGASTVTLASSPSGWKVGDELLIPDTAAPSGPDPRRESSVTISAIEGTHMSLSKPLDFAHENITDPNGVVVLRPRVANLTRNIVIRSENPDGTRGHTADVGHTSVWDIRYNQLIGLGRTRTVPLDDTVPGTRLGANQRGKYAEHHHHVQSASASSDVGNVYMGRGGGKWGLVVHVTSDTLVERNIAIDFPGAGFITEDGYEVRNVFRQNFAAYNSGHLKQGQGTDSKDNVQRNCPGCEGSGFWLRGIMNAFEGNEAWNNGDAGINLFNQQQPAGLYPSRPGGDADTPLKHFTDRPISFTGNVVAANGRTGLELWGVTRYPYRGLVAAYNAANQVFPENSDGISMYLQNPTIVCTGQQAPTPAGLGVHASMGYVYEFTIDQGQIAGCAIGIVGGGGIAGIDLTGTTLQNEVNIEMLPRRVKFDGVMHVPLRNLPHRYILMGDRPVWNGTDPLPNVGQSSWIPQRGSQLVVKNWQGTGKDYLLFPKQALGNNPAWYSASGPHSYNTPIPGLTMQQSWDRYGLSIGGDVLTESEAVQLDGLVNGLARDGLGVKLGPPRAIVTFPTMRENAVVEGGVVRISALLTGDPNAASGIMMMSVDGDRPWPHELSGTDDRGFTTNHISPGVHEVKVWRTQKANPTKAIPGSEYTSQYCVGACPTIPHGRITLSPNSVTFSAASRDAPPTAGTVTVSNSGVVALNWVTRTSQPWCSVKPYGGSLAVGASTTLSVSVSPPPNTGSSVCTVTVLDNNADNSPQTIAVNYAVAEQRDF
jgi:Viral BACON domain